MHRYKGYSTGRKHQRDLETFSKVSGLAFWETFIVWYR